MLISCRKEGESLEIGEEIEIRIIAVRKNKVTLGIVAPRDVKIATRRLSEMEMANTMAAAQSLHVGQLLRSPRDRVENIVFVLEGADFFGRSSDLTDKRNGRSDE
jgi:carbon storage regulator